MSDINELCHDQSPTIVLADFQLTELKEVEEMLKAGEKRIVVSGSAGVGKTSMIPFVIKLLNSFGFANVLCVFSMKILQQNFFIKTAYEPAKTIDMFLADNVNQYDAIIFDGIEHIHSEETVEALYDKLTQVDCPIVSFNTPFQSLIRSCYNEEYNSKLASMQKEVGKIRGVLTVFSTQKILDIDHIGFSDDFEKGTIAVQFKRLRNHIKESENNNLLKNQVQQLENKVKFLESCIQMIGIPIKEIESSMDEIENYRQTFKEQLDSSDEDIKEKALVSLQDKAVEVQNKLLGQILVVNPKKEQDFKKQLISYLSEKVWNMLNEKSKVNLLSALISYDEIARCDETLDFSGVCMSATKAVDEEAFRRFLRSTRNTLNKNMAMSIVNGPEECWILIITNLSTKMM